MGAPVRPRAGDPDAGALILRPARYIDKLEQVEHFQRHPVVDDWLARVETPPEDAARVKELLGDHVHDGVLKLDSIVVKARRSQK